MSYIPPKCSGIVFSFGPTGYTPPQCSDVSFDFTGFSKSTLQASIEAMQPFDYINNTYTYTKRCPSYLIGYRDKTLQILNDKCSYGGVRGITSNIIPITTTLPNIGIKATIKGLATSGLNSFIETHIYGRLLSSMKVISRSDIGLPASARALIYKGISSSFSGTHNPKSIQATVFTKQRSSSSILSDIRGFGTLGLWSSMRILHYAGLVSAIYSIEPSILKAEVNIIEINRLTGAAHGLAYNCIGAYIKRIYSDTVTAKLNPVTDTNKKLKAILKGFGESYSSIRAVAQSYHISNLKANLLSFYFSNISAGIKPIRPFSLFAKLHSWDHANLLAQITGDVYLWKLKATINVSGDISNLLATINPISGRIYGVLPTTIHAWKVVLLSSYISISPAPVLSASINPIGNCRRLLGSIKPKTIRLTTIIDVATMSSSVISGMINSLCFSTGYKTLRSYISTVYKSDLTAYVRPIIPSYNPSTLTATIGYTSYINVEDKFRLSINVSDGSFMVVDKYRFVINFLKNGSVLSAGIRGVLRSNPLRCSIVCREIPAYNFTLPTKNTEQVVHRSYDGNAIDYETVELAFNSIVKDYFYSSSGNELWKSDRLEKWSVGLKSILIENAPLRTKRILNKSTVLRNLKNFTSIDDAVKYAINYVTDRPSSCINAYVRPTGYYTSLISTITPKTFVRKESTLSAHIEAESVPIILSIGDTIIVI